MTEEDYFLLTEEVMATRSDSQAPANTKSPTLPCVALTTVRIPLVSRLYLRWWTPPPILTATQWLTSRDPVARDGKSFRVQSAGAQTEKGRQGQGGCMPAPDPTPKAPHSGMMEPDQAFHRSATVGCTMSLAITNSGSVQALTSLAMAPKQRLNLPPYAEAQPSPFACSASTHYFGRW